MCQEHEIHDTKDQGKSSSDQKQRDTKLHTVKELLKEQKQGHRASPEKGKDGCPMGFGQP
jgi:hypothetical protein